MVIPFSGKAVETSRDDICKAPLELRAALRRMCQLQGLGLCSLPSCRHTGRARNFQGFLTNFILLEGDLGGSAPRQAAKAPAGPSFSLARGQQRLCKGGDTGQGLRLLGAHRGLEKAGERRQGKEIRDNVFNLIRSLESFKCILPWLLKFLS